MTLGSKNLITALRNILSKLELTAAPDRDEESFVQLKHILKQRIQNLEKCASIPSDISRIIKPARNTD